jgi:hypothetical protein
MDIAEITLILKTGKFLSMKRYLLRRWQFLLPALIISAVSSVSAQTEVKVNTGLFTDVSMPPVNQPGFPFRWTLTQIVAPKLAPPAVTDLSDANPKGKCMIWLEYGDGGFTVQPITIRNLTSSPPSAFLMATPLYDTTRGKDGLIARYITSSSGTRIRATPTGRSSAGHNDSPLINANTSSGVKLTPNAYNIVPGEPFQLAMTYKFASDSPTLKRSEAKYYVLLYYNNNKNIFENYSDVGPNTMPAYLRTYKNETLTQLTQQNFAQNELPAGYNGFASFELPTRDAAEYNFFITMKPGAKIVVGDKSSISAVLFKVAGKNQQILGQDSLSGMYVSRAFDPNAINVTPACLVLPKKETDFKYRVQFQNLGKGPADTVKILIPLPAGMRRETLQMGDVMFSGKKIAGIVPVNSSGNTIQFMIAGDLPGTSGTTDALTNPLTMGEVNFTIKSTAGLEDSVKHHALIYFHSKFANVGKWEDVVSTDTSLTVYKKRLCDCGTKPCPPDCFKIFGLCWWVWVLILMAIIILLLWLRSRRR